MAGGTAVCGILVGHDAADGFDPLLVEEAQYVVQHADGPETVVSPDTPVTLAFSAADPAPRVVLPFTISTHPGDELLPNGLSLRASASLVAVFNGLSTDPFPASFGDHLTVVAVSTCPIPTTTMATTSTTTSTTSTTVQTLGFPRLKVCTRNGVPKKCD